MELTKAGLDALVKLATDMDQEARADRLERRDYYKIHGHTNADWLDQKIKLHEATRDGMTQAAQCLGIDIRSITLKREAMEKRLEELDESDRLPPA